MSVHLRNWKAPRLVLLALILLLAQTGALLHSYSHRDLARQDGAATTGQCSYCKAAVPLLGAVGAPVPLGLLLSVALVLLFQSLTAPVAPVFRLHPAFRSRAPPRYF